MRQEELLVTGEGIEPYRLRREDRVIYTRRSHKKGILLEPMEGVIVGLYDNYNMSMGQQMARIRLKNGMTKTVSTRACKPIQENNPPSGAV